MDLPLDIKAAILIASCVIAVSLQADPGGEVDEYEYADEKEINKEIEENKIDDGDRLVGGKMTSTRQFPFLVGWNSDGSGAMHCTGSLITPTYFISAAHCNDMLGIKNQKPAMDNLRKACVEMTERNGFFQDGRTSVRLRCRWLRKSQAFEFITDPPGKAWLGVSNIHHKGQQDEAEEVSIKRHLRHLKTYRGGGSYGRYGGYDFTLLELMRPVGFPTACLPSPSFDDIRGGHDDTILAGFGLSRRSQGNTCQTNRFGPMKFHYCDKTHGRGSVACVKNRPPPQSKECDRFFDNEETPDDVPSNKEEIRIRRQGQADVICNAKFNPENYDFGWCYTKGDYYKAGEENLNLKSWGFCGRECYLKQKESDSGILHRKENIHILPHNLCEQFLDSSLRGIEPEVRPTLLCVASQNKWKEEIYEKIGRSYRKVNPFTKTVRYGRTSYVASVGTCNGDSGGPAFVEERKGRFVVTGVVSGGRGTLGECGGVNNPIHYVRVRSLTRWIVDNIGHGSRNQLCWNTAFQERLDHGRG